MALIMTMETIVGDSIEKCAKEMVEAADRAGVIVKVQFNDVTLYAKPGGSFGSLVANYHEACDSVLKYKSAWTA